MFRQALLLSFTILMVLSLVMAIPSVNVAPPSGTIVASVNSSDWWDSLDSPSDITIFVKRADWTTIDDYPSACGAGEYVSEIGDTLTCSVPSVGDTNESARFGYLTATDCSGTDKVVGVYANGTVMCAADLNTGGGSIDYTNLAWINQSNTFTPIQNFTDVNISGNLYVKNIEFLYNHTSSIETMWNSFKSYWYNHTASIISMNIFALLSENVTLWAEAKNKYNSSYEGCLNNESYLSTYNSTYHSVLVNGTYNSTYDLNIDTDTFRDNYTAVYINISVNNSQWCDNVINESYRAIDNDTFSGNLYPDTTLTYDIGSGEKRWGYLYAQNISSEDINTYNLFATYNITAGNFLGNTSCENITGAVSNLCTLTASGEEADPIWQGNYTMVTTINTTKNLQGLLNSTGIYETTNDSYITTNNDSVLLNTNTSILLNTNSSILLTTNSSLVLGGQGNRTLVDCHNITGGSDADYCADATAAGGDTFMGLNYSNMTSYISNITYQNMTRYDAICLVANQTNMTYRTVGNFSDILTPNNASVITTFNVNVTNLTYQNYAYNVSLNWTALTVSIGDGRYWNASLGTANITLDKIQANMTLWITNITLNETSRAITIGDTRYWNATLGTANASYVTTSNSSIVLGGQINRTILSYLNITGLTAGLYNVNFTTYTLDNFKINYTRYDAICLVANQTNMSYLASNNASVLTTFNSNLTNTTVALQYNQYSLNISQAVYNIPNAKTNATGLNASKFNINPSGVFDCSTASSLIISNATCTVICNPTGAGSNHTICK